MLLFRMCEALVNLRCTASGTTVSTIDCIVPLRGGDSGLMSSFPGLYGRDLRGACDERVVSAPLSEKESLLVENGSVVDHIDGAAVVP
jgi:hypothetical protein